MRLARGKRGKSPRSVYLEIGFWREGKTIHIGTNDHEAPTFHVAVRDDGSKPNGHPSLYRELSKCLKRMGLEEG